MTTLRQEFGKLSNTVGVDMDGRGISGIDCNPQGIGRIAVRAAKASCRTITGDGGADECQTHWRISLGKSKFFGVRASSSVVRNETQRLAGFSKPEDSAVPRTMTAAQPSIHSVTVSPSNTTP